MSLQIEARTSQIAHGRNWVAAQALAAGVAADLVSVVTLLASELITNAIVHGSSGGPVQVRVVPSDGHLRVEVDDESTAPPRLRHPEASEIGGRGIQLVDVYSDRWGWTPRGTGGKTVWFDLVVDPPAEP